MERPSGAAREALTTAARTMTTITSEETFIAIVKNCEMTQRERLRRVRSEVAGPYTTTDSNSISM